MNVPATRLFGEFRIDIVASDGHFRKIGQQIDEQDLLRHSAQRIAAPSKRSFWSSLPVIARRREECGASAWLALTIEAQLEHSRHFLYAWKDSLTRNQEAGRNAQSSGASAFKVG
jgi:hypothetical protein